MIYALLTLSVVARVTIVAALAVVIYRQINLIKYKAPHDADRLRRLMLVLTLTMITLNLVTLAQTLGSLAIDDWQLSLITHGDGVYMLTRLVGDIIGSSIIYLIYKEVEL